jgi:hypothetical protein
MIRRLAYVSRPRPGLPVVEIPRIVSVCRARNEAEGISGMLLYTGLDFAQVIEGPSEPVENLWARIRADDRHCDIVTLIDEHAPSPWFTDWRVGYPAGGYVMAQVSAWRNRACGFDETERLKLRQLLVAADAI